MDLRYGLMSAGGPAAEQNDLLQRRGVQDRVVSRDPAEINFRTSARNAKGAQERSSSRLKAAACGGTSATWSERALPIRGPMSGAQPAVCDRPARLGSTRFPKGSWPRGGQAPDQHVYGPPPAWIALEDRHRRGRSAECGTPPGVQCRAVPDRRRPSQRHLAPSPGGPIVLGLAIR